MLLSGQALAGGVGGGLGAVGHPGLGEDAADVMQHGVGAGLAVYKKAGEIIRNGPVGGGWR